MHILSLEMWQDSNVHTAFIPSAAVLSAVLNMQHVAKVMSELTVVQKPEVQSDASSEAVRSQHANT